MRAHAQFRPLTWRQQHPYVLADRMEDMTDPEAVRTDPRGDREVALYGYLRGCALKPGMQLHLAGLGDVSVAQVTALPDPCPLPGTLKRRSLDSKERLLYAPMSDVGRMVYDKDAMYVTLPDHKARAHPAPDAGISERAPAPELRPRRARRSTSRARRRTAPERAQPRPRRP